MRKSPIILIALITLLTTSTLFAQRDRSPENRATKMAERMTETLNLSDAQSEKVKTIHLKYGERMKAMHSQQEEGSRDKNRAAMKQMRADLDAELKTVLTDEQYQKFQEMPRRGHGKMGHDRHGFHGKKRGKYRMEARTQYMEKIQPILLEQRAKLESKISDEDKMAIVQLRVNIKKEKAAHKAQRKAKKEERKNGKGTKSIEERKAEREKWKAEKESNPNFIKLVELTKKYSADIEPLFAEVEPQIKALKEEWKKEKREGRMGEKRKGKKGGKGYHKKGDGEKGVHKEKHQNRKYARFLLLDPNATADQQASPSSSAISNVTVYPNPSQGISHIEYDLGTPGMVTIELHDKSGNLIETIDQTNKTAGSHKTSINFSKYTVGVYYIVLKDAVGAVVTKKVIR